jgi:hypothetical protein
VQEQNGDERALLPSTERERPLTGDDLERPEQAEIESSVQDRGRP